MKINFLIETFNIFSNKFASAFAACGIHTSVTNFISLLREKGFDVTINGRGYDYDIFHTHTPSPDFVYRMQKGRSKGVKSVAHAHTTVEDIKGSFTLIDNPFILKMIGSYLTYFYNQADTVLAPSEWCRKTLLLNGVKRPISVLSNGVNLRKFKFNKNRRKELRETFNFVDDIVVYSVGLVILRKGIDTFVRVAEMLPEINFFWFGKIQPLWAIKPLRVYSVIQKQNKLNNLKFFGYLQDIVAAHCGGDIFFFPSYVENQGIAILEAAACKRPIVVRDLPVYDNWLFDGKNCLKAKNDLEFKEKILTLSQDKKLRNKLGRRAYRVAKENDIKKSVKKLIYIYENL